MTHKWNGKKTRAGRERCSKCGLLRESYTGLIRRPILNSKKQKVGTKPVRITKYNYFRGNKQVFGNKDLFGRHVPECKPPEKEA